MSQKLKPCPFCGKDEAEVIYDSEYWECGEVEYSVCCGNCGATGKSCNCEFDAINAWNTRKYIEKLED